LRPLYPNTLHATQTEDFGGLPEGITRWRLAAALRSAARLLDLSAPMMRLLEHYIDCTYDVDWTAGCEPIITRPLTEIATCLGRSERQIRNIERALAERGLLGWRDSGNHHRRGQRDRATGRLLHGYGPTLLPLAARAAEIVALASQARTELAELRRSRLAIGALRRRLRCALAALPQPTAETGQAEALLHRRLPARLSLIELDDHREALRDLTHRLETKIALQTPGPASEATAQPEISRRPVTETRTNHSIKEYEREPERRPEMEEIGLPTGTICRAAGPMMRAMLGERTDWPSILKAAESTAPMVGLDAHHWRRGCEKIGRVRTALAIIIMEHASLRSENGRWAPLRKPKAYFEALVKRGADGNLHLDRSIRHLARNMKPERTAQQELGYSRPDERPSHATGHLHESA
jgi:replication initiation protein RepC